MSVFYFSFKGESMYKLYNGDCLEIMDKLIEEGVIVDAIICDPPYGTTACKWDTIIPFDEMWERLNKLIKPNGAIILFAQSPFANALGVSNLKMLKYEWIWKKTQSTGFLNAKKMPLKAHENILVFYKKLPTYNPQKFKGQANHSKGTSQKNTNNNYGKFEIVDNREELGDMKHPRSIWSFQKPHPSKMVHPTEKSLECVECLIKTYTNEGDIVLDNTMGSGTTCLGALNTNRYYVGIEKDEQYFEIAVKKIEGVGKK